MRCSAVLLLLFFAAAAAWAQVQTPSFALSLQGSYTWSFALGIGDREALRGVGLTPWVPSLRQGFVASIEGKALDIITVKARLDSSRGVAFQDFGVYLDAERWKGVLGNFSLGNEYAFAVPPRTLLGARLAYLGDGFSVEGLASRALGKLEVRVFRGERGHMETEFDFSNPRVPWEPPPYRTDLQGLYYFELSEPYVPDFTRVRLILSLEDRLWNLLTQYGLDYLREVLEREPEREVRFKVIKDSGVDVLLLLNAPRDMVKRWVEDAIGTYNERHDLAGADAKRYPFVPGSELEREFLGKLASFVFIRVNGEEYALGSGKRRRYLDLGAEDVIPETLEVEIRRPGEEEFRPLRSDGGFSFRLFAAAGVLRIDFPEPFFAGNAALRVTFDYSTRRSVFVLSPLTGIVPNSERVYRDGRRLRRGQEYSVDYEGGIIQLFSPLKEGEELRVEYEVPHGLGTGPQEDFLGLSLSLGNGARLFVFRSAESVPLTPSIPTMPNDHTVAGLMLSGGGKGWDYSLVLGGSVNVFPPGKNERVPGPNRITAIASVSAPDGLYTVFSHLRGISVFKDGVFSAYRSGRRVYDLLYLPQETALVLAERGAVVIVDLSRSFPFDWRESYTELFLYQEGPGGEARLGREALALAADEAWIYVATEGGIIRFPIADIGSLPEILADEEAWRAWKREHWKVWIGLPGEGRPTAMISTESGLYLGTEDGLYLYDDGGWVPVIGIQGPVYRLVLLATSLPAYPAGLYVAAADGIVRVRDTVGEAVFPGVKAMALAFAGGTLYYGTEAGLFGDGEGPLFGIARTITALEASDGLLWLGSEAWAEEGQVPCALSLWSVDIQAGPVTEYPESVNRILPTDPGSYRNISPEDNTDRGLLAQFTWREQLEDGNLSWYVRTSTPGYEPLDRPPPGDTHSVGFSFSREAEGLSLGIQGSMGMRELFTHPVTTLRGDLTLSWSPGPKLDLRISPRVRGLGRSGPSAEAGYTLALSWENPREDVGEGLLREVSVRVLGGIKGALGGSGGTAELRASLGPFGPFTLSLAGRRPFLFGGEPTGTERVSGVLSGGISFFGLPGKFSWKESWSHDLGPFVADGWRFSRDISFVPELQPLRWDEWEFRPSLTLSLGQKGTETSVTIKGSPSLGRSAGGSSARFTLGFQLGFRSVGRTGDVAYSAALTPKFSYTLPSLFRLELDASGSIELIQRRRPEDVRFEPSLKNVSLTLTPLWWEGIEPRVVLTYTPGKAEISLRRTSIEFSGVGVDVTAKLTWQLGSGDLGGEIKFTTVNLPLSEDWSLNLEGGYLLQLRRGRDPRQGIFLRGNLALSFSF